MAQTNEALAQIVLWRQRLQTTRSALTRRRNKLAKLAALIAENERAEQEVLAMLREAQKIAA